MGDKGGEEVNEGNKRPGKKNEGMTLNWNTVPLENYIAIDNLRKHPVSGALAESTRDVSILSLLTGKPESCYEEMKLPVLQEHLLAMHAFLNQEPKEALVKSFKIKGRTFYIGTNFDEWTESQRRQLAIFTGATLEDYSMLQVTPENYIQKSPELVAILCEERTKFRKKLHFDERVKLIREHLSASIGIGLSLFFWAASSDILPILASHLRKLTDQLQEK